MLLEPEDTLGVEMVSRFVEEEQVGGLDEELTQRNATTLTAGENRDRLIRRRAAQRIHRLVKLGVNIPRVGSIDLGLQLTHLVHESIKVASGFAISSEISLKRASLAKMSAAPRRTFR